MSKECARFEVDPTMTVGKFIRLEVFGVSSQADWAAMLGISQASASRFDTGNPLSREAMNSIRALVAQRGGKRKVRWRSRPWDDAWLFDVPNEYWAADQLVTAA